MTPVANDTRHTAVHEAGHAVIARMLTLSCGGASIRADHNSAGHAITHDPYKILHEWECRGKVRADNALWYGRILAFMAGAEAENVILGGCDGGDGDDRYQINLMAEEVAGHDQWQRAENRLRAMTRALVRRNRARIDRVADALLAKGKLSSRQIDKLCGRRSVDDVKVNAPFLLAMHGRVGLKAKGEMK
jgi:ATP-dependent Zn protease